MTTAAAIDRLVHPWPVDDEDERSELPSRADREVASKAGGTDRRTRGEMESGRNG